MGGWYGEECQLYLSLRIWHRKNTTGNVQFFYQTWEQIKFKYEREHFNKCHKYFLAPCCTDYYLITLLDPVQM